jgi:hypothetical protein
LSKKPSQHSAHNRCHEYVGQVAIQEGNRHIANSLQKRDQ